MPRGRRRISTENRIASIWGERTPCGRGDDWPERTDQFLTVAEDDVERWVHSACVLCSHGCGMDIAVRDGRIVGVRGRTEQRTNRGRLGPKGLFGWQANGSNDRLSGPLIRRDGELVPCDWDTAMDALVRRSRDILDDLGPMGMAFYTSGQLFLEEYYALAMIARAGIGTPHLDGNTRLCTATAEWALIESFGTDGDPGCLEDLNLCDTLFVVGHNMAETQTVMWMRVLDRLAGPDRPRLVAIDPRPTPVSRAADIHLAIRPGTNVMVLNAILHELIANDHVDGAWVDEHTVGFDALAKTVAEYPPDRAAAVCGVDAADIRRAATILGNAERLVSTVLQGVYQSHQATAAAVQVNNVNLIRGMIGRPGATVFQMNGQPTAQNTRETGADGAMPVQLNWQNDTHMNRLAKHWNVRPLVIPHWSPPTHIMQIVRHIESGVVRFLWVSATNPAVSLPELARIRSVLGQDRLFLVVQDAFPTETTELADLVLPAAMWGEKQGVFTNADRSINISDKAVEPPGEARADFDIFLEYARRMDFRDKDGAPLLKFATPEEAFDDFKALSDGRPSDYSGLTYAHLREASGIQWPVNAENPDGKQRLYDNAEFHTGADYCQSYGHDLLTGAVNEADEYRSHDPEGRAVLKAADYLEPHEPPDDRYPFVFTTGRTVYHWHTRTKTARTPQLETAAPEMWVEVNDADARNAGAGEGDWVEIESRRGTFRARLRITEVAPGVIFAPFHYGYWDPVAAGDQPRAANEVTLTDWDPVSKQPIYKACAVALHRLSDGGGGPSLAPTTTASAPTTDVDFTTTSPEADAVSIVSERLS